MSSKEEIIRAEQAAADKIKIIDQQQYGHQISLFEGLKRHWFAVSAALAGAGLSVGVMIDLVKMGAAAKQTEQAFTTLAERAGESGNAIVAAMKKATAGTIDDSDMMQKAIKGMALGLSGSDMTMIAEMARQTARITGESVGATFEKLADSISTKMPRALMQMGLITKEQMKVVEEALSKGVEDVNLLAIARANFQVQQAKLGPSLDNEVEAIQRLNAQWSDFKETIGITTIGVIMGLVHPIDTMTDSLKNQSDALDDSIDDLGRLAAAYRKIEEGTGTFGVYRAKIEGKAPQETSESRYIYNPADVMTRDLKERIAAADAAKKSAEDYKELMKEVERESIKAQGTLLEVSHAEEKVLDQIAKNKAENEAMSRDHYVAVMADLQKEENAVLAASQAQMEIQAIQIEAEISAQKEAGKTLAEIGRFTAEQMQQNFSDFFFDTMQGEFTSLEDFATATFKTIQRAAANYLGQIATEFLFGKEGKEGNRSGGWLASMFSGWGAGAGAGAGASMGAGEIAAYAAMMHEGGVVGESGTIREVPAGIFDRAPRFHRGLTPDEMPAILQKGETVIPKGKGGEGAGGGALNVTINAVDARSFAELTSRNPNAIVGPIMEALQRGGQLRNMIRGVI